MEPKITIEPLNLNEELTQEEQDKFNSVFRTSIQEIIQDPVLKDILIHYAENNTIYIGGDWLTSLYENRLPTVPHGSKWYEKEKVVVDPTGLEDASTFTLNIFHEIFLKKMANHPFRLEILKQELEVGIPEILLKKKVGMVEKLLGRGSPLEREPLKSWFENYLAQDPPVYFYKRTDMVKIRWLFRAYFSIATLETIAFCHWTETLPMLGALSASRKPLRAPQLRIFYRKIIRDFIVSYLKVGD